MIFMRGWTDVFMMPWWGRRREGMPNGQKIRVLGVSAEWMQEDTEVRPYDAAVLALPRLYWVSDHGQPCSC